jgi:alpha/beta superfamily hydrolase
MKHVLIGTSIIGIYEELSDKSALLCPPHPKFGGSKYDIRLDRISKELHKIGVSTLRFDYTSVERAIDDARVCLTLLKKSHSFVAVIGYSFGSVVASNIADNADALVLISPLKSIEGMNLKETRVPKLIIYAKRDKIIPVEESKALAESLSPPKEILELDTDHLYSGKFDVLSVSVRKYIEKLIST